MTRATAYRSAVGVALGSALFLLWAMGAVGIIGAEGDRADLMYLGVLAVGIVGVLVARFRARGMALALGITAAAQVVVTVIALVAGLGGDNPRLEIVGINLLYVTLFATSAGLFLRAADGRSSGDARTA